MGVLALQPLGESIPLAQIILQLWSCRDYFSQILLNPPTANIFSICSIWG